MALWTILGYVCAVKGEKMHKENTCKKCGSGQVYLRISTNERVCRICGFIEKIKKVKDESKKSK
jgi:uncharacterized protein (DUF983 family)